MPENDELKKYLDYDGLAYLLQRFPKTTVHCTFDDEFAGETATLTHGTTTYTKTVPATSPFELTFAVNELGTWTLQSSYLGTQYSDTVDITYLGQKGEVELTIVPDGSTAEPINSIPVWLKCANLNKSYTTLAEVLADTETYETLLADSNACQYMKRSTGWASVEGLVPEMTSATTPSGNVTTNSYYNNFYGWKAFDRIKSDGWMANYVSTRVDYGDWIKYDFGSSKVIRHFYLWQEGGYAVNLKAKIQASNDDSTWVDIHSFNIITAQNVEYSLDETFVNNTAYRYWKLSLDSMYLQNQYSFGIRIFQFYSDADITHNQDAMARLGKFDYACNLLISDSTWCEAILNSDYFESVCNYNVPAMTSNTTPEGEASASSVHSNQPAYMAFDRAMNHGWHSGAGASQWLQYRFVKPIVLKKVKLGSYNTAGPKVTMVQGSNDGSTWSDIGSFQDCPTAAVYYINNYADNNTAYTYIRLAFSASNYIVSNQHYYANIIAQFWGRASEEVLVPLVPTMTSNTTPSGRVIYDSQYNSTTYAAWKAFDRNTSSEWSSTDTSMPHWCGYDFEKPVIVNMISLWPGNDNISTRIKDFKIQGSNTGNENDWNDIYTGVAENINNYQYINFNNSSSYRYYRIYIMSRHGSTTEQITGITELQFYRRTVQTNIIHSAPNDTVYMLEDGDPIVLATTNSDGDGILDFSQLPAGPITLYSSVAKNPEDLTADYSKTIMITKTQYGGTTEAYLMPDTIKTLYWWGIQDSNLEPASPANGWNSKTQYNVFNAPVFNTNYAYMSSYNGGAQTTYSGIGSKDTRSNITKLCLIGFRGGEDNPGGRSLEIRPTKSSNDGNVSASIDSKTQSYVELENTLGDGPLYIRTDASYGRTITLYALWCE